MRLPVMVVMGASGAVARYVISGLVQRWGGADFPIGTLVVNMTGALAIGLTAGSLPSGEIATNAAVAFLAGYTTFSTWMVETLGLGLTRLSPRAVTNLLLTLTLGTSLTALGYWFTV